MNIEDFIRRAMSEPLDPAQAMAQRAIDMTSEQALTLASAAALGAGSEQMAGHTECANFKLEAAAVWVGIHEKLVEQGYRKAREGRPAKPEQTAELGPATTARLLDELAMRFEVATPNEEALKDIKLMSEQLDAATLAYSSVSGNEDKPVV